MICGICPASEFIRGDLMLLGYSRISLVAFVATSIVALSAVSATVKADRAENTFKARSSAKSSGGSVTKLFNFGSGSSASQAAVVSDPVVDTSIQNQPTSLSPGKPDALDTLSSRTKIFSANRSVAPIIDARSEANLKNAIENYEEIDQAGRWGSVAASKSLRKGGKGKAVLAVRRRLAIEGYLPRSAANSDVFDQQLAETVGSFQENHGLKVTGTVNEETAAAMSVPVSERLDTLLANLIRLPEYTKDLTGKYVVVNIPAAKLEAVEGRRVVSRHTAIVGKPERPSPVVTSEVSEINFNPYWHSPKSIVIKDIVPKVRKSRAILDQMQIKVFDGYQGPEVDPDDIDWDAPAEEIADKYHFRQEPGGENAMASVKINFKNKYSVYMHDTPTKTLFQENQRYFSSGCVRVEDVQQLTSWILGNQDGWNLPQIQSVARSEERIDVNLKEKVSVRWVYLTAWAGPDGIANFRDDIYSLDGTGFITGQPIGSPEESAG